MSDKGKVCPQICPDSGGFKKGPKAGGDTTSAPEGQDPDPNRRPYEPGKITPLEPRPPHPSDAPPLYLPQTVETRGGDIEMGMGPTGPWASGHIDWTPLAGMTGTRPVVDKYSITRYSLGEWRKHNEEVLNPEAITQSNS